MSYLLRCVLASLYIFYISSSSFCSAEGEHESLIAMANLEGEPSAFIHGCVNVISGQFCDSQTDLVAKHGVNPIHVERVFFGTTKEEGVLGPGWALNHFSEVEIKKSKSSSHPKMKCIVRQDHGAELTFNKELSSKAELPKNIPIAAKCLTKGVTNCASGYISAQTNVRNHSLNVIDKETSVLKHGSGSRKVFRHLPHDDHDTQRIHKEAFPNGNKFLYEYNRPHLKEHLSKVTLLNNADKPTASLNFDNVSRKEQKEEKTCTVSTQGGDFVRYKFRNTKGKCVLSNVIRSTGPSEEYSYAHIHHKHEGNYFRIKKRSRPNGRYLDIDYLIRGKEQARSLFTDRVIRLNAPAGTDEEKCNLYTFYYEFEEKTIKGEKEMQSGRCYVYDAYDGKSIYNFNGNQRLTSVVKYRTPKEIYTCERMYWGDTASNDPTRLMARTLESPQSGLIFGRTYTYDNDGNVIKKELYGNLNGHTLKMPRVEDNGIVAPNDCPCYRQNCVYSKDGLNLLLEESDGQLTTHYQYAKGTNRCTAKFQSDRNRYLLRWFYEYNDDGAIIKEIHDDGTTEDQKKLTGVTERQITYYKPSETFPVALPLEIEKKCLDLVTNKEILIERTVNTYNEQGRLATQEHYDNQNILAYTLAWEYDRHGNITKEWNAQRHLITREYDANDNCILEKGPHADYSKIMTYDYMDRLINETETHTNGVQRSTSHEYDLLGRRTATFDAYGNKTTFAYDSFGRVIEIIYPEVVDENNVAYKPTVTKEYDEMGRVKIETDAKGYQTHKWYTVRDQLSHTLYPDGSTESKSYNWNGTPYETIDKSGTHTYYTNDALGRPLKVEMVASDNTLLSTKTSTYSGFHLLTETDAMGVVTQYQYYPNGNLKSKQRGTSLTTYEYDSLGRISKTIETYGSKSFDVIVKKQEHDLLDHVIDETIEDGAGNIQKRTSYTYDVLGNINKIITYPQGKRAVSKIHYNSLGIAARTIDAAGNRTITTCRYDYINQAGQCVPYKEVTDPLGNRTITIQDAMGRDVSIERKDVMGSLLQKQELFYDRNGNCSTIIETVITPNAKDKQVITKMEYDCLNRITACFDAVGSPEQKITRYTYNLQGQQQEIIKGDGVKLTHVYDALGRLHTLTSSDGTVAYRYSYDRNNNPLKIEDLVNTTVTTRKYDRNDHLIQETLGNGLGLDFTNDRTGRTTKVTLPDSSSIQYEYHASLMRQVVRQDKQSNSLYAHSYDSFDRMGNLLQATLAGQAGSISYQYDIMGRLLTTKTANWEETVVSYDKAGNILEKCIDDGTKTTSRYTYDQLYQLSTEDENGISLNQYTHDSRNNRVSKNGKAHKVNKLDQLMNDGEIAYRYDDRGNLKIKKPSQPTHYVYDALDRLTELIVGRYRTTYSYDSSNRRLSKTAYSKNESGWRQTSMTRYFYHGQDEIGACDEEGQITELRLLGVSKGAEIGAAIAIEAAGKVYVPIHDHSGNLSSLVDLIDGHVVGSYRYSAFGEELFEECPVSWRYSSKRYDPESGFLYFGRRYYSPSTGRWTTPDPIGREDGPNLYAYVRNNPLTHIDLYGLYNFLASAFDTISSYVPQIVKSNLFLSMPCNWGTPQSYMIGEYFNHEKPLLFTNGINTTVDFAVGHAKYISEMAGGSSVDLIYNTTSGVLLDAFRYYGAKHYLHTKTVDELHRKWNECLASIGNDRMILQLCHSEGVANVRNALISYDAEKRKRIAVVAFAPSVYIDEDLCGSIHHYTSRNDFVPLIDNDGRLKNRHTTTVLKPAKGSNIWDHDFRSPTYAPYIQKHINKHLGIT